MAIYIEFDWLTVPNWNLPLFENTFSTIVSFVVFSLLGFQNFTFIPNELTMSLTTRRIFFHDVSNMVAYEVARDLNFTVFDWQSKHLFAKQHEFHWVYHKWLWVHFFLILVSHWIPSISSQKCSSISKIKFYFTLFAIAVLFSVVWIFFIAFMRYLMLYLLPLLHQHNLLSYLDVFFIFSVFRIFSNFFLLKNICCGVLRLEIFKILKIV